MTSMLIDPVAVAEKVLASPKGWSRTSVFEIKAMAGHILYQEDRENDPDQPTPIYAPDGTHLVAMRPRDTDAVRVPELVAAVNRTFDALESARFSAREAACRHAYKEALKALSNHFATEIGHAYHNDHTHR